MVYTGFEGVLRINQPLVQVVAVVVVGGAFVCCGRVGSMYFFFEEGMDGGIFDDSLDCTVPSFVRVWINSRIALDKTQKKASITMIATVRKNDFIPAVGWRRYSDPLWCLLLLALARVLPLVNANNNDKDTAPSQKQTRNLLDDDHSHRMRKLASMSQQITNPSNPRVTRKSFPETKPHICLALLSCCDRTDLLNHTLAGAIRSSSASCFPVQPFRSMSCANALASSMGFRSSRRQFSISCRSSA